MNKPFSVPLPVSVSDDQTIVSYVVKHAAQHPEHALFEINDGGTWRKLSARDVLTQVRGLAVLLYRHGLRRGDAVAMMSRTRLEWSLLDLAAWYLGATVVPVYESSSAEQTQWILSDSAAVLAVAETSDLAAVITAARDVEDGHRVETTLIIDKGEFIAPEPTEAELAEIEQLYAKRSLSDIATIIYTSGTTGKPKGVELTQGNFVTLSEGILVDLHEVVADEGTRTLLFLPMAHVFARILSVLCIIQGVPLGHIPDTAQAVSDIATFKPTFLMSVPRIWEKVYTGAEQKQGGGLKRRIFIWAVRVAIAYSRSLDAGGPSPALKAQHRLADKLVLSKLRAALGGNLTYAISGGAPLGERLGHFYRGVGLVMLEGYGLTETTAPLTVNRPDKTSIGSVGYPLPGTSIAIADDGEILAKGVGVFERYHNNEQANAEAFRDGWFATGDLGDMDENGFVRITGRKKEIIVTAGGKNVAPSQLEDRLRVHPLVSQCMVVGDGRPFVGVLVTLDRDMLPIWLKNKGIENLSIEEAKQHPVVLERLNGAIKRANVGVSRAESIRAMRILDDDFTVDNGALTPSLKVKRHVVTERYAKDIDALYADAKRERDANGAS
ncbi:long-chain fatty acid--CoA ligase [Bowdeniella nasicola]|uniref:Acyl-CoA synthetase n=1 Tax=Bowdeniella nasicola TaxID=208480 RepID=A0A1Q5Q2N5_9ACTO|nr:AMP-dependent synthetase/ligase [Bowdeniella nasicola]OKL54114.1 long-chain fatty acid--CoA ligase [Bowdeniella nasicola]